MAFDGTKLIMGAVSIIIGIILLPLISQFTYDAKQNTSVAAVAGLTNILDLIVYGFSFGLVGLGVGLIYLGFKK